MGLSSVFNKLLTNQTIFDGEGNLYIRTKKLDKLYGEAFVNVRKRIIISIYELSVVLCWEGEAKDSERKSYCRNPLYFRREFLNGLTHF
nr:activator of 90 kDa heat shock protein ATPase homolog [Ipomoea batatas]GMD47893.1 activator of 90 kDa heat shock protein ATPase homolog [Ipomoea batatas]